MPPSPDLADQKAEAESGYERHPESVCDEGLRCGPSIRPPAPLTLRLDDDASPCPWPFVATSSSSALDTTDDTDDRQPNHGLLSTFLPGS